MAELMVYKPTLDSHTFWKQMMQNVLVALFELILHSARHYFWLIYMQQPGFEYFAKMINKIYDVTKIKSNASKITGTFFPMKIGNAGK